MKKVTYPQLLAEISKNGDLQKDIADLLSIGESTVCRKVNGKADWKISEIKTLCRHYGKTFEVLFSEVKR